MYLFDTNVVSELRKRSRADARVIAFARGVKETDMFLSVISLQELETGVLLIQRRDQVQGKALRHWLRHIALPSFSGRILSIDEAVALRCAELHVPDPKTYRDAMIAATALVHGLTIVTRNVRDFEDTGVTLINPWLEP